jgi:putative hydrolase of the HAD superfamily
MKSVQPIQAYLVDLDGTLYRPGLVKLGMALELLLFGLHRVTWLKAFRHEHELMRNETARSEIEFFPSPFHAQLLRAAEEVGADSPEFEAVVRSFMIERPGKWIRLAKNQLLLKEISAFHAQGGKTAIVSDYPAAAKLEALGARSSFDVVVANGETEGLTRIKPAPSGYLLAASALGVPPENCLVLGDRDDADGEAARRAGMQFRLVS